MTWAVIGVLAAVVFLIFLAIRETRPALKGAELEDSLRTQLAPQIGSLADPSTINCPDDVTVRDGDVINCSIDQTNGTVLELVITAHEEGGELRFVIDVDGL